MCTPIGRSTIIRTVRRRLCGPPRHLVREIACAHAEGGGRDMESES
jgi:hypothetical protein